MPQDPEAARRYHTYIRWRSLSNNGARKRADLSPAEQQEWDALGITEAPAGAFDDLLGAVDAEGARRQYMEATGRS
jgi:hypothetical protein